MDTFIKNICGIIGYYLIDKPVFKYAYEPKKLSSFPETDSKTYRVEEKKQQVEKWENYFVKKECLLNMAQDYLNPAIMTCLKFFEKSKTELFVLPKTYKRQGYNNFKKSKAACS